MEHTMKQEIYDKYLDLINEGYTDREARFELTEMFGPSEDNDDYASFIDYMEYVSTNPGLPSYFN